jgi:nucleotide-binding universal stress UspA family protein
MSERFTIVLGYDDSDCAHHALERCADLARRLEGALVVVTNAYEFSFGYVPMGVADSPLLMSHEFDEHVDLVRSYAEERVAGAAQRLEELGVAAETRVAEGRPVDVLLDTARERQAALIVVGSHGEGALAGALLGSTALKLLHQSEVPVLVVPLRR